MPDKKTGNCLNVQKFFETLAKIIGDREGVEIKVAAIRERKPDECNMSNLSIIKQDDSF